MEYFKTYIGSRSSPSGGSGTRGRDGLARHSCLKVSIGAALYIGLCNLLVASGVTLGRALAGLVSSLTTCANLSANATKLP